jgi:hypothetical protein
MPNRGVGFPRPSLRQAQDRLDDGLLIDGPGIIGEFANVVYVGRIKDFREDVFYLRK